MNPENQSRSARRSSLGLLTAVALGVATALGPSCKRSPPEGGTAAAKGAPGAPLAAAFSVRVVGKGPPVLLLPGLASPGSVWDGTVAHLQGRYTLHVFTLAGFGGQPPRPGLTLDDVRAELVRYIREQKLERPVVIGHSLGGFLAYWLGATAPESVGPLVAVDGVPFLPGLFDPAATEAGTRARADEMRASFQGMDHERFVAGLRQGLSVQATSEESQAQVLAWCSPSDPGAVGAAIAEVMTTDLRPRVSAIRSPVLLLAAVGGAPAAMRSGIRALYQEQVASIPHHEVLFLDRSRHFVMLDDPAAFFAALDTFLDRTGS